jgi:uncharacterized membrane protein YccC
MLRKQRKLKMKQALKVGTACLLCVVVNYFLKLPSILNFFSVLSVFALYTMFPEEVYQKSFERFLGVVGASLAAFIAIYFFGQHLIFYWAIVLLTLFVSGMLVRYKFGYIFIIASIVSSIIMLLAVDETRHQGLVLLLMANGQLILAWMSIVVFEFFFPIYSKSNLAETLRFVRRDYVKHLLNIERYERDIVPAVSENDFELLEKHLSHCRKLSFSKRKKFRKVVSMLEALLYEFNILKDAYLDSYKAELFLYYECELGELFLALRKQLMAMPDSVVLTVELERAYTVLKEKIISDRSNGVFSAYSFEQVMALLAIKSVFSQIVLLFRGGVSKKQLGNALPANEEKENHQLLPMTGLRLIFVIAVVITAKYVFGFQEILQMTIAGTVIAIQPNIGKSVARMKQRFVGVALGGVAALGIISILHIAPFFPLYFLLMLVSLVCFAYLALGDERYAYIGVQAGFVIPLVIMGYGLGEGNLPMALARLLGVLQGSVIGAIAILIFQPKFPLAIYRANRSQLLNSYVDYFSDIGDCNAVQQPKKFSQQFISNMNKRLQATRASFQDLTQVVRKKSTIKKKIDRLMPIFTTINLNIRVINMLLLEREVCQLALKRLAPVCVDLEKLFKSADRVWGRHDGQLRQEFHEHALAIEKEFAQRFQSLRAEKLTQSHDLRELEAYGLFLTAFVNITVAIKGYGEVVAVEVLK